MYKNIYDYFVKKIDLSSACSLIGLCPKEKQSFIPVPDTVPADKCAVCTKIESRAGPEVRRFKTKLESLKTLVSDLCSGNGNPRVGAEVSNICSRYFQTP